MDSCITLYAVVYYARVFFNQASILIKLGDVREGKFFFLQKKERFPSGTLPELSVKGEEYSK